MNKMNTVEGERERARALENEGKKWEGRKTGKEKKKYLLPSFPLNISHIYNAFRGESVKKQGLTHKWIQKKKKTNTNGMKYTGGI